MSNTQIITMKMDDDIIKMEDIIKTKNNMNMDDIIKPKRSKKTCAFCKKRLTLVDKALDKCKGCNKRFCLTCLKPEIHTCPNKTKEPVVIYKSIAPSKIDHI